MSALRVRPTAGEFWRSQRSRDGLQGYCKVCSRGYEKQRYGVGRPKPGAKRRYYKDAYGLTLTQIEELKARQGGVCAICGEVPERAVVDHCHKTGLVRGILCNACNRGMGMLRDSLDVLRSAVTYLATHQARALNDGGDQDGNQRPGSEAQ
ncbi:hypothetical protein GCM10029964_120830 [Kibdelosporangium lantanae]